MSDEDDRAMICWEEGCTNRSASRWHRCVEHRAAARECFHGCADGCVAYIGSADAPLYVCRDHHLLALAAGQKVTHVEPLVAPFDDADAVL